VRRPAEPFASWSQRLRGGGPVEAFDDLVLAPLTLDEVVRAIRQVIDRRLTGVVHLSGLADVTYAEFAKAMAVSLGRSPDVVRSTSSASAGRGVVNPQHATLDDQQSRVALGLGPADDAAAVAAWVTTT
jgi:dTDP-4-dehydrorhamnose reductase